MAACNTGPPAIENGYVSFASLNNVTGNTVVWNIGTTLTYKCFRFYALVDSATQTCSAGLGWVDTVPRCEYSRTTKIVFWVVIALIILLLLLLLLLLLFLCCYFCRCCKSCCGKRRNRRLRSDNDVERSENERSDNDVERSENDVETGVSRRRSRSASPRSKHYKSDDGGKSSGTGCCACCFMPSRKTHPETRQKETSSDDITRRDEERRERHTTSESHGNRTDDEDCCSGCCWTTRGKRSGGKQDVILYKQYEHGNHAYQYEQYPVRDYAGVSNKDFLVRKGIDSQENKRDESPRGKSSRDSSSVRTDDEDEQNNKTGCCAGLCLSTKGTRRRRRDDVIHNKRYEHGAFAFHNKNYEVKDYAGVNKRDQPSCKGKTDRVRSDSPKQSRSKEAEDVNSKDDDDDEANPGCCACCCGTTKGRRKPVTKVEQTQHVYTQQPELYDNSFGIYNGNQPSKSELKETKRKVVASKPEISKDKTKEYHKEKDSKQKPTAKKVETLQTSYATPVDANEKEYQEDLDRMEQENVERVERENELRRKEKEERDRKRLEDEQKRTKEKENERLKKAEDEQRRRAKEREIQHQQQLELARLQNELDQTNKEHEFHERDKQRMAQVEKAREREEEKRKEKENQEREKELQRKKNIEKERQDHEERLRRLEEKEKEREQYRQRQLQLAKERADERKREREDRERQRQQRLADLHENKDDKPDKVELDDDGYFDVGSPQRSPNTNDRRKEKPKRKVPPPRYLHNSNDKYLKGVNEDKIGHRGVHNPTLYVPPKKVKPVNFWRPFKNAVRFVNQSTL